MLEFGLVAKCNAGCFLQLVMVISDDSCLCKNSSLKQIVKKPLGLFGESRPPPPPPTLPLDLTTFTLTAVLAAEVKT